MTDILLAGRTDTRQAPTPRPLRVMVVDPQPEGRSLLKGALRNVPYVESVRETGSSKNILEVLADSQADVVIIEQNLGDEDVFAVVKRLRSAPELANARFILLTSSLDMEGRRKGMEVGIQSYLSRPYDINGLERALRDAMGKVSTNHKDTLNKVRRIEFFSQFSDMELVRLLKICHTRKYQAGETIFSEGENGDRLYVLVAGQVQILKQRENKKETLAKLSPGDCFGEMALVDQEPRSADAIALNDCMIIELNAEIINDVNDILALKLFRRMAMLVTKKLREYTRQNRPH
jgi:CRP-like cAMP-binding protein